MYPPLCTLHYTYRSTLCLHYSLVDGLINWNRCWIGFDIDPADAGQIFCWHSALVHLVLSPTVYLAEPWRADMCQTTGTSVHYSSFSFNLHPHQYLWAERQWDDPPSHPFWGKFPRNLWFSFWRALAMAVLSMKMSGGWEFYWAKEIIHLLGSVVNRAPWVI